MRILAIRGENLASLEDPFDVDLEHGVLGQAGLFSITGTTGAGKSTLLDAMCLALYDQTPRLADAKNVWVGQEEDESDRENAKDVRSIMRRGSGHCRAEVEFIGKDGARYLAQWEARRARRKPDGRLQPQAISLRNLDTEEIIGDKKTETLGEIEDRLGLSFDQFRRSVLLAQGDFAAFLKADANVRAELLERMTGTEIYSWISRDAFERMRTEEKALEVLSARRDQLEIMSDEEREKQEGELKAGKARLAAEKRVQESADKAVIWYKQRSEFGDQVESGRKEAEAAKAKCEEATSRRELMVRIREAEPFRSDVKGLDDTEKRRIEAEKKSKEASEQESRAQSHRETALQTVNAISTHIARLAAEEEQRRGDAEQWLAEYELIGPIEKTWKQCAADINALAEKGPALRGEIEQAGILAPDLRGLTGGDFDRALASSIKDARANLKAAEDARSLEDHRSELVQGRPCPLCGSEDHPWAGESPLSSLVGERQALVSSLGGMERKIAKLAPIVDDTRARLGDSLAALGDWEEQLETDPDGFAGGLAEKVDRYREESGTQTRASELLIRVGALISDEERARVLESCENLEDEYTGPSLAELTGHLSGARKEEESAREEAAETGATVKASLDQLKSVNAELDERRKELAAQTADAGIRLEEVSQRLAHERAWVESEDQALSLIDQALDEAQAVLKERERRAKEHLDGGPPEMTEDDAKAEVERVAEVIEGLRGSIAEANAALERDKKARDQALSLDGEIKTQREKTVLWQKLGQVIGSADGKKLRKFAQSLTLMALIGHANVHLEELARRYRLERVPNTDMDIQIVDQEMADEIRSVNSLSGGETFLVSLALALGLASLSAREMSVESLFIDEGFGSLDIETLEIALSALESLHAAGRQVGIISHVQGLADHISAQVVVEKVGAGRSRVVVG